MTDLEILHFLYELKPESKEQDSKIKKMMNILINDRVNTTNNSIKEYLEPMAIDEIIDKNVTEIYTHYCNWCTKNNYEPESKISFSKYICRKYSVKSVTSKVNGELKRLYKL